LVTVILLIFPLFYLHKREAPLRREAKGGGLPPLPKGRYWIIAMRCVASDAGNSTPLYGAMWQWRRSDGNGELPRTCQDSGRSQQAS